MSEQKFSLLASLPLEITEQILTNYLTGKALSTLALALASSLDKTEIEKEKTEDQLQGLSSLICQVARTRLLKAASFIEANTRMEANENQVSNPTIHAVNWIRSVVDFSFINETSPLSRIRVVSQNLALVDLLEESITTFSRPHLGQFEWPVWCGQLTVDSYVTGSRMRNTARVVITAPVQSPSYIPGCNLIKNHTPSGIFRCEPYNMIPVSPWGRLRALSQEDWHVLQPVSERLERLGQVAVPAGYHNDEILDIRVLGSPRARQLLSQLSWKPKSSWILDDNENENDGRLESFPETGLICGWQEDTMEIHGDRDYLYYVVDLLRAMDRMQRHRLS